MRVEVGAGLWGVIISDEMPPGLDERRVTIDRLSESDDMKMFALVSRSGSAPSLLVVGTHSRSFSPGLHVIPETETLLVGCGEVIAAYDMPTSKCTYRDITPGGFLSWNRHDDVVVMGGELEVAGYNLSGERMWSASIEPPWDYGVSGTTMFTIVMGHRTEFPLREGPKDSLVVSR
jgi:hypothetical protein